MRSGSGARGRGHTPRTRAASGIMLAGITTGAWGAATGLGQAGAGNARVTTLGLRSPVGAAVKDRALLPRPRKPGLELSRGNQRPSGKSRGGTPIGGRLVRGAAASEDADGWIRVYRRSASLVRCCSEGEAGRRKACSPCGRGDFFGAVGDVLGRDGVAGTVAFGRGGDSPFRPRVAQRSGGG